MFGLFRIVFTFVVVMQFVSCNQDTKLKRDVETLYSMRITLPYDRMIKIEEDDESNHIDPQHSPFKMILFVDSTECSPCRMKSMYQWNEFLYLEKEEKVDFVFIFQPKEFTNGQMKTDLLQSGLEHSIYADTCGAFLNSNKELPGNAMLHCFLVNEKDSVVLVGDPTRNTKIRQLLLDIVGKAEE